MSKLQHEVPIGTCRSANLYDLICLLGQADTVADTLRRNMIYGESHPKLDPDLSENLPRVVLRGDRVQLLDIALSMVAETAGVVSTLVENLKSGGDLDAALLKVMQPPALKLNERAAEQRDKTKAYLFNRAATKAELDKE